MSNKDKIEEKLKETENQGNGKSVREICRKYKLLIIYCIVVLAIYVVRYVVIPYF
ncbi:MAG: hypothetical protein IJR19_09865 [Lachnospiraceae bacterium]|nr:hypothetical protein [Lachnospiraceae bacterium]